MIKLLIFDWDDVFVLGSKIGYFSCYHKALEGVGIHLSPEEEKKRILAKWSKPYTEEIKELLKERPDLVENAVKIYEKEYWGNTFVDSLEMLSGANKLLLKLKEKYTLAIATGNHPKMLKEIVMPHFHVPQVFSMIVSSHDIDDVEKMKPHPYMLEMIMKKLGSRTEETVYVGDAKTDMEMAKSARVTPVAVLTGHMSREDATVLNIKFILENVLQLESVLDNLNSDE